MKKARKRIPSSRLGKAKLSYEERLELGFARVEKDLAWMMDCLQELFSELGEKRIQESLPFRKLLEKVHSSALDGEVTRSYAIAFGLLNLAEEVAAEAMRRLNETINGPQHEPGSWAQAFRLMKAEGTEGSVLADELAALRVEPVLTAHPTEARRRSVLACMQEIHGILVEGGGRGLEHPAERELRNRLKVLLERWWRTEEVRTQRPTVDMEREGVIHCLAGSMAQSIAETDRRLREAWNLADLGEGGPDHPAVRPQLRFGTWVGGDRDGHPLVTPETTQTSLQHYRAASLRLLGSSLEKLASRLTLSRRYHGIPSELDKWLVDWRKRVGAEKADAVSIYQEEPWREAILLIYHFLPKEKADVSFGYRRPEDLISDLGVVRRALLAVGAARLAAAEVDTVIRLVEVFGFHLAVLDIRQNSARHDEAIEELEAKAGSPGPVPYRSRPETERRTLLEGWLEKLPWTMEAAMAAGPASLEVMGTYKVLAQHAQLHGIDGLGLSIISMTRDVSDLLAVYVFSRLAGFGTSPLANSNLCPLPVTPLFETLEDLRRAPQVVKEFLEYSVTKKTIHLLAKQESERAERRRLALVDPGERTIVLPVEPSPTLRVMIGYSDSNKDAGLLASQWALHQSQRAIQRAAREEGAVAKFFHGRGGTVSRGAGPTHRFLEALPKGTLDGDLRVTEQGEVIGQKYGTPATASYNLELLLAGTARSSLSLDSEGADDREMAEVFELLATTSKDAYYHLIQQRGFLDYFRQATPIDVVERSTIGSRPSHRTGAVGWADLRAIPWVFSWSQARFFLPGWYGAGTALERLAQDHSKLFRRLQGRLRVWPFARYVFNNLESGLASSDMEVGQWYADLVKDDSLRSSVTGMIRQEYEKVKHGLSELFDESLAARRPRFRFTVERRVEPLRALHARQVELLRQWRTTDQGEDPISERLLGELRQTIAAIAAGLRTTG